MQKDNMSEPKLGIPPDVIMMDQTGHPSEGVRSLRFCNRFPKESKKRKCRLKRCFFVLISSQTMNSMTTGKKNSTSKPLLPWIWHWLDNPPLDTWEMMDWWTQGLRPSRFLSLWKGMGWSTAKSEWTVIWSNCCNVPRHTSQTQQSQHLNFNHVWERVWKIRSFCCLVYIY